MSDAMLFGKLPAHGDFVARGMTAGERAWWDDRVSLAIDRAMDAYGADFDARYDAAVPWCFHIRRGETMLTGAIAASADRVGRRFPVVLAHRADAGAAACATVLRAIRDETLTADALIDRLGDAVLDSATPPRGWWPSDTPMPAVAALTDDDPIAAVAVMLGRHAV